MPEDILLLDNWWWLRSPSNYQGYAAGVTYGGSVEGYSVSCDSVGVRPAFRINNLKLLFGEKVYISKTLCTVIGEGLLLSDKIICQHNFDGKFKNDWETSELKRFIESDYFKNLL